MRVRARDVGVAVALPGPEAAVLMQVLSEQSAELGQLDADDPRWRRLHPAVSDDEQAAAEFAEMVVEDLDALRLDRIGTCLAQLTEAGSRARRGKVTMDLDDEDAQRWIAVLNDLRLMHGTALGVSAENSGRFDPQNPDASAWAVYHWLTGIQDAFVTAVMR